MDPHKTPRIECSDLALDHDHSNCAECDRIEGMLPPACDACQSEDAPSEGAERGADFLAMSTTPFPVTVLATSSVDGPSEADATTVPEDMLEAEAEENAENRAAERAIARARFIEFANNLPDPGTSLLAVPGLIAPGERDPRCASNECEIRNRCTGAACCPKPYDPATGRVVATEPNDDEIQATRDRYVASVFAAAQVPLCIDPEIVADLAAAGESVDTIARKFSVDPEAVRTAIEWCRSNGEAATAAPARHAAPERLDEHAQPLPTPSNGPAIVDLVLARPLSAKARAVIEARRLIGRERYGTDLQAHNGRDVQRDFTDEAADAVNYAMQGVVEAQEDAARAVWERRFAKAVAMLEDAVGEAVTVPEWAGCIGPENEEAQAAVDAMIAESRSFRGVAGPGRVIKHRDRNPKPSNITLTPGSTWTGPDGTVYDVVRPEEVQPGQLRWWASDNPHWIPPASRDLLHAEHWTVFGDTRGSDPFAALVLRDGAAPAQPDLRFILGLPAGADDEAVRAAVERLKIDADLATKRGLVLEGMERDNREIGERLEQAQVAVEAARERNTELFAQLEEARSKLAAADRACEAARKQLDDLRWHVEHHLPMGEREDGVESDAILRIANAWYQIETVAERISAIVYEHIIVTKEPEPALVGLLRIERALVGWQAAWASAFAENVRMGKRITKLITKKPAPAKRKPRKPRKPKSKA